MMMRGKRLYITIFLLLLALQPVYSQQGMIIMRNGMDFHGQIVLVSKEKTVFKNLEDEQQEILNKDIYMIKYDKRGNVFFTESGERVTDNTGNGKIPKGASAIYLIEGKEIVAYDISIDTAIISYLPTNKKGTSSVALSKNEVFLICHQDGTKDLIMDFDTLRKQKAEKLAQQKAQEEATARERWLKSFPKSATIITKKETVIYATVLSESDEKITYRKALVENSPIYTIDKANVQDVFYKDKM